MGLDWQKYVEVSDQFKRPLEVESLQGDTALAKSKIGWDPKVKADELAKIMVDADLLLKEFRY